ncbi:MAG: hypothetical protein PVI09_23630, partial [Anaerolineae bacterium]
MFRSHRVPSPPRLSRRTLISALTVLLLLLQSLALILPAPARAAPPAAPAAPSPAASAPAPNMAARAQDLMSGVQPLHTATGGISALDLQPAAPRPADPKSLPANLLSLPEVVERREEYARHYDLGSGRYLAYVSQTPLHYRNAQGEWAPVDPAFDPIPGGWWVDRNSLRMALPERSLNLQLEASGVPFNLLPRELAATGPGGETVPLAEPRSPEDTEPGRLAGDHQSVVYTGAWDRSGLEMAYHSQPGAVQQELIVRQPLASRAGQSHAEWLSLDLAL